MNNISRLNKQRHLQTHELLYSTKIASFYVSLGK